jgi:glycosyltransferase involved in cell wall biosynthesis
MDLTLLTCNYNTPELIVNLLKSVKNVFEELPEVMVMNTSSETPSDLLDENEIPYFNFRNGIHGEAVNLGLSKVKTRYVLLVDSDIIFLKDIKKMFEKFKSMNEFALMGKVVGDCAGKKLYPRVEPWFCFIDNQKLKNHKIKFFDRDRHMLRHIYNVDRIYDIGSTMFEDVTKIGYSIADISVEGKTFIHYGGMSWRGQKFNPNQEDTDIDFGGTHPHRGLYELSLRVKAQYDEDVKILEPIDIKGIFK